MWVSEISTDTPIYLVGGVVRDWIIGRSNSDLDVVIEGDAIAFAQVMQAQYGGSVLVHDRFGTAKWITPNGEIDFVTARKERYAAPAALPVVTPSSIADDLRRRDFTINALALRLDGDHLGEIVDLFGGESDLEAGLVRVLHPNSFVDDPTRIFRAVRYEQRLGFAVEPQTLGWLMRDKGGVALLSGDRVRHEIEYMLNEPQRSAMLERLEAVDLLSEIVTGLKWEASWAGAFDAYQAIESIWGMQIDREVYLLLWLMRLNQAVRLRVFERLNVGRRVWDSAENAAIIMQSVETLPSDALPSQITFALDPFRNDTTALLIASLLTDCARHASWLKQYQKTWRNVRAPLTGDDLRQMGLPPSPLFREILDGLRGKVLDEGAQWAADRARSAEFVDHFVKSSS
jgi:tRNA nucleotidyltransferase (CCA-adding enzyme)